MGEAKPLSPEVVEYLNQLRQGSLMYVLSNLLIYTGLIALFLTMPGAIPLLSPPNYYSPWEGYSYLSQQLERTRAMMLTYVIIDSLLIISGLILLLVSVLGALVSGCDGLAYWNPMFRTGARLFHAIRTSILMIIAGYVLILIGIASPLASSILVLIAGVLALVLALISMMNKEAIKQIHILSAIPEVFHIYFAVAFIIYGVLGVVFHEALTTGLTGAFIILLIGFILMGLATTGITIVFLQLGRIFKSTAMMLAGVLNLIPILNIAAFIIVSMEIPEIISSSTPSSQI